MNMKQGTSEAVSVFGERGSKEAENRLFRDDGAMIPFVYRGNQHSLFATRVYKHIGTLAPELKARLASVHGVSTALGRYFFRRSWLPARCSCPKGCSLLELGRHSMRLSTRNFIRPS